MGCNPHADTAMTQTVSLSSAEEPAFNYVRSSINFKTRPDLMSDVYETVVVDVIKPNSQPFSITAVYRPPGTDNDFFFSS